MQRAVRTPALAPSATVVAPSAAVVAPSAVAAIVATAVATVATVATAVGAHPGALPGTRTRRAVRPREWLRRRPRVHLRAEIAADAALRFGSDCVRVRMMR